MAQPKDLSGISITLDMDITRFSKAMGQVQRYTSQLDKDLKQINKALELNPDSVDTLKAKLSKLTVECEKVGEQIAFAWDQQRRFTSDTSQWAVANTAVMEYSKKYDLLQDEIAQTKAALDNLANGGTNFKVLGDSLDEASSKLKDTENTVVSWKDFLKADLLASAIKSGINILWNGIKKVSSFLINDVFAKGIEYNANLETYTTTIKANLDGDEQAANRLVGAMKNVSSQSAFSTEALLDASTQLVAAGNSAEETEIAITSLAKSLALAGKSDDELKRMAQNLNQIQNAGKATAQDVKQFAYAGVPIYRLLREYSSDFNEITSKTVVQYEDIVGALNQAASVGGSTYDAFTIQAETYNGQLNAIKNNWATLTGLIAEDATQALTTSFLPAVNEALQGMINWQTLGFSSMSEAIGSGISDMLLTINEKAPEILEGGLEIATAILDGLLQTNDDGETVLEQGVATLVELLGKWVLNNWDKFLLIGMKIAEGIIEGLANALASWMKENGLDSTIIYGPNGQVIDTNDYLTRISHGGGRYTQSLGYGSLASGGFSSGGITLNASFNMANTQLNETSAKYLADLMADEINNKLGGMM